MGRMFLRYAAGLIALYIGVAYATGSGTLIKNGAAGTALITKTFQGR